MTCSAPTVGSLHAGLGPDTDPAGPLERLRTELERCRPATVPTGVGPVVDLMATDPGLVRVDQVARSVALSERTLQRRFRREVGIGPKWVLSRFRLQEAALALERDPEVDLGALAPQLGFYDQAHLTNTFVEMLGETPSAYAARAAGGSAGSRPMTVRLQPLTRARVASLGERGEAWAESLPRRLAELARDWGLDLGRSLPGGSNSYVVRARTADGLVGRAQGRAGRRRAGGPDPGARGGRRTGLRPAAARRRRPAGDPAGGAGRSAAVERSDRAGPARRAGRHPGPRLAAVAGGPGAGPRTRRSGWPG